MIKVKITIEVLIYKMTHLDDPDPRSGEWGRCGCLYRERQRGGFGAVIGVGGKSADDDFADKVVWIGLKPRVIGRDSFHDAPVQAFDRFSYFGVNGQSLLYYPAVRRIVYDTPAFNRTPFRHPHRDHLDPDLDREVKKLLAKAA